MVPPCTLCTVSTVPETFLQTTTGKEVFYTLMCLHKFTFKQIYFCQQSFEMCLFLVSVCAVLMFSSRFFLCGLWEIQVFAGVVSVLLRGMVITLDADKMLV